MSPIVTTDWRWLIVLAWGRRRVSSRAEPGTRAYPQKLTAALGLWRQWIWETICNPRRVYIVVTPHKAEARIDAQIADLRPAAPEPQVIGSEELANLLALRAELRSQRKFIEADQIRDDIIARGGTVSDAAVGQ